MYLQYLHYGGWTKSNLHHPNKPWNGNFPASSNKQLGASNPWSTDRVGAPLSAQTFQRDSAGNLVSKWCRIQSPSTVFSAKRLGSWTFPRFHVGRVPLAPAASAQEGGVQERKTWLEVLEMGFGVRIQVLVRQWHTIFGKWTLDLLGRPIRWSAEMAGCFLGLVLGTASQGVQVPPVLTTWFKWG